MEKGVEKGAIWFLPLLVVGSFLAGTLGMVAFSKSQASKEMLLRLESLAQKDVVYLDKDRVIGASSDYEVYTSIRTAEGEYALAELISAELENDQAKGLLKIEMPNGELVSGDFKSFLPTVLLKDGRKTQGEIIDKAVAVFKLKDGRFIPIKIVNGKIEKGRLTGVFSGRTLDTGFQIVAEIRNRKISYGYLLATPTYIPSASRTLAYLATVETSLKYEPVSFLGGADILAAHDEGEGKMNKQDEEEEIAPTRALSFEGKTLTPNYDAGTYEVVGEEGAAVSLSTITEIIRGVITPTAELVPLTQAGALAPGVVTSSIIKDLTITNDDIALETIDGSRIKDGGIESADIKDSAVTSAKIADSTITSDDIYDNTITTSDLSGTLTFSSGDLVDLSGITHSSTSKQGLILPNVSSASPSSPSSGEGYIAYDISGNSVIVYNGSSWTQVGSGDITGVTAGNGLTGGGTSGDVSLAVSLTSSGGTGSTSSNSGLEVGSGGLSLLKGCASGEILKWNDTSALWECGTDSGGAGGGISTVQENDTTVVSSANTLDFLGTDFAVSESPAGEANVSIDYTNSGITRLGQAETITGGWTFGTSVSTFNSGVTFNTDSDFAFSGTENIGVTSDLAGTVDIVSIIGTPSATIGTTRGLILQQANHLTNTNGLDTALLIDNADTDLALATAIQITNSGGGGFTNLLDTPSLDISGTGVISGATGISSSGIITFSGLTADRLVTTTTGGQLTTSISSANLALSVSDETGSGALVFATSPSFTTPTLGAATATSLTSPTYTGSAAVTLSSGGTSALTLDSASGAVAVAAGDSLGNGTWSISSTGLGTSLTANDLSCTDCIGATEIADLTLGTDTIGNYVATGSSGNGVSLTGGGSEGATLTAALGALTSNWDQTGAFDISLNNTNSEIQMLESGVTPTLFGILDVGDLSGSSSTYTFSGATGTVLTSANYGTTLDTVYAPIGANFVTVTANGTLTGETGIDALMTAISTTSTLNVDSTSTLNAVTLDAGANLTTTAGSGSLVINSTVTSAGDKVIEIVPNYTGEVTDLLTYSIVDIAAFTATNAAGTDTVKGVSIGNLTEAGVGAITSTAITIGTGWDTAISIGSGSLTSSLATLVINAAGAVDIQDNLTADQLTTDVGGVSIAASQSYTGTGAVTVSSGGVAVLTLDSASGTVTIAAGDAVGNGTWSIASTGVGTSLTATDLSCTNCIGATEVDESTIASTSLSDTANIAYLNQSETIVNDWTFTLAGTEDLAITHDLAGTANMLTLTGTPNAAVNTAYGIYIDQADSVNANGLDAAIVIDNSDLTGAPIGAAIKTIDAGGGFTNLFDIAGTLISTTEFTILDAGIALSELTDSGTLTATTVDINGGNIDGVTIGAASAAAGTFTTLLATTSITVGNGSGNDFLEFIEEATDPTCAAGDFKIWASTSNVIKKCQNGTITNLDTTGGTGTLQDAYTGGGSITTSDAKDIDFILADTTTNSNFDIDINGGNTVTITRAATVSTEVPAQLLLLENADADITVTDGLKIVATAGAITDGIDVSGSGITNAINIGANIIAGTNFSVTGAGAVTAVGVNSGTGLIQGTGGLQTSGAASSINASSNFNTSINTGTSTGTAAIGNALATVTITSNTLSLTDDNWSIGTGGAISTTSTLNVDSSSTLNAVTLDAGANLTTTAGAGSIVINSTVTSAGDEVIDITPSYTGEATDLLTYSIVDIAAFTATNAVGTDTVKGLSIGNLTESGGITSTAISVGTGWDTILGGTTAGTNLISFTNFTVTTGGAVTAVSLDVGEGAINNFAGNAGLAISTNTLIVDATTTGTTATTSSNSGLEIGSDGLRLLGGCTSGTTDILKWNGTNWVCSADATGGSPTLNSITAATADGSAQDSNNFTVNWNWDFTAAAVDSGLNISETTASTLGTQDQQALVEITTLSGSTASPLQITSTSADVGDIWINLASLGDLEIRDAGTAFVTFSDAGLTTFVNDVDLTFGAGENLNITASAAPTTDMVAISNSGQGTITTAIDGLQVNLVTAAVVGSVDNAGVRLVIDPVGATEAGDTVEAIDIASVTNPLGTVTAIRVGTGWDTVLSGTTAGTNIFDFTNFDVTSAGAVTAVGINSGSGLIQGAGGLLVTGTVDVNTSGAGATNIGTGTSTGTITIGRTTGTDLALSDAQWSITGPGAASFASLSVGGTADPYVDETGDTMSGALTFNVSGTDITTVTDLDLTIAPSSTGDTVFTLDADTQAKFNYTSTTTATYITGAYGGAATLGVGAAITGASIDLSTNLTFDAGGNALTGLSLTVANGGAGTTTAINIAGAPDQGIVIGGATTDITTGTGESLVIVANGAGTVDIQDATTVDSLTTDTGGITILAGQAIVPSGAGALTIGNVSLTALTVTTDGTGNAEVVLPNDSIGPNEVFVTGQTDEFCLTYEATGTTWEWQTCGGGGASWDTIGDPTGAGAIAFGSTVQTLDWGVMDANASFFTFNFTNAGTVAGTDSGVVINNVQKDTASTDTNTENLLLIQQLDTSTGSSIVVDNALKIDSAGNANITDAIEITNSVGNITNGINIVDSTGTIDKGIVLSGTFTTAGMDFGNAIAINIGAAGTDFGATGGLTLADALTVSSGGAVLTGAVSGITTLSASGTTTIGSGGNTFTFNPASGPVYAGTARPTKRITLTPEYAGSTLTGDGTSNSGTMTSDTETATPFKSYYNWTSTQGTAQDYDIWIRVPLPSDFDAMASTDALTIEARSSNLANTTITIVQVYDTANAADCTTGNINIEPGTVDTWADTTPTDTCTGGTYAADGIMTVQLRLSSLSSANARVGRLYIQYKAKF